MANLQRLRNAPGLTPEDICIRLSELARQVPGDEAIVEIGVYKGRTVSYLAFGTRQGEGAAVYGIDPWDLQDQRTQTRAQRRLGFADVTTRRIAERTVQQQGMRAHVTLIRGFSTEIAESWDGPKIGLLFVDGDHTHESVRADVQAWLPHLAEGPVIAFDDYGKTVNPGVSQAVNEFVDEGLLVVEEIVGDGQLAIATLAVGHEPVDARTETEREADEQAQASREEIPAEIVESDTAGTGEAVNADTGEITAPGEPLPPIEQDDGEALEEAQPEPPPRSGAGSGVGAWRAYAEQVTTRPAATWAQMNRQEIIDELTGMGVLGG
jgi:predicted O-methyltransferase YrrM